MDKNGTFDELVASDVAVHLEMLTDDSAYLNIYTADQGVYAQVNLYADKGKLTVHVEDYGVWTASNQCAHEDTSFDRTLCAEPCGVMHTYCQHCGECLDECEHDRILE
jgi:ferredoxin